MELLKNFWSSEEATAVIEYGLIASLLGVTIIYSLTGLGGGLGKVFGGINASLAPSVPFAAGRSHGGGR